MKHGTKQATDEKKEDTEVMNGILKITICTPRNVAISPCAPLEREDA